MWQWQRDVLSILLGVYIAAVVVSIAAEQRVMSEPSTTRPTGFVYHPDFLLHDPGPDHPERPARLQAIMAHLKSRGLLDTLLLLDPEPASEEWITRVHTPTYLRQLQSAVRWMCITAMPPRRSFAEIPPSSSSAHTSPPTIPARGWPMRWGRARDAAPRSMCPLSQGLEMRRL